MKHWSKTCVLILVLWLCLISLTACGDEPTSAPPVPSTAIAEQDTPLPSPSPQATPVPIVTAKERAASEPPSATQAPTEVHAPTEVGGPATGGVPTAVEAQVTDGVPAQVGVPATVEVPDITGVPTTVGGLEVDLGLPGGDCYQIQDLVVDRAGGRLYALCARTDVVPANTIVVVDSSSGEKLAQAHLAGETVVYGGQLALDPEAGRLYTLIPELDRAEVLDADTLAPVGAGVPLPGVSSVLAAPGSGRFYVLAEDGLMAYSVDNLSELGRVPRIELSPSGTGVLLGYNGASDQVYAAPVLSSAGYTPIQVRSGASLSLEDEVVVAGSIRDLVVDSQANRLFVATREQLIGMAGESLDQTARDLPPIALEGGVSRLEVDETTGRLHIFGLESFGPGYWLIADAGSLETLGEHSELPNWGALGFDAEGNLLAVRSSGEVVTRLDPETGQPQPGEKGRLVLGIRVLAALPHPEQNQLYVVDSSGALRVLDAATLQEMEARPALLPSSSIGLAKPGDIALALDPKGDRLFIADVPAGQTLALDLATFELVGTTATAGDLAVDIEGGRLFVADRNVYAYDVGTLGAVGASPGKAAISFEIEEGQPSVPYSWANGVLYDSENQRLLVRIEVGGSRHVGSAFYGFYDGDTLARTGSMRLDLPNAYLNTPILLPDSDRMLVAYSSGGRCQTSRGPLTWDCRQGLAFFQDDLVEMGRIRGLSGRLATSPTGHTGQGNGHVYLRRGSHLLALDAERGYPLAELALGKEVWEMVLGPAQDRFYHWAWDRLASLPTSELLDRVPGRLADPPLPEGSEFLYPEHGTGGGGTVFAAIPAIGLYRSMDGSNNWQLASWGLQDYYLGNVLFPDSDALAGTVFVEVDWPQLYRSTDGGQNWQPDGFPRLAFVSDRSGNKEIYAAYYDPEVAPMAADPVRLTDNSAQDDNPAWSPHGGRLVFQSDRNGNHDLWIMNWDGSGLVQLTTDPADDLLPAWSPDGEEIAFVSSRDGAPQIWLMTAPKPGEAGDESTARSLTHHPDGNWRPAWSRDGSRIAFTSPRDGDNEIYVMPADGSSDSLGELLQITHNEADDRNPSWMRGAEDGLYFLSDRDGNFEIYGVQLDREGVNRLTDTAYDEGHVAAGSGADDLFYVTEQTGTADVYHMQRNSQVRRLTQTEAHDTAPAWNPWVLVAPQSWRATPTPRPLPTKTRTAPPTPATVAGTPDAIPPVPTTIPGLPVLSGTPVPSPLPPISVENASSVVQVAHWGGGEINEVAYAADGSLLAAAAKDGIYLYDGKSLEPVRYIRTETGVQHLALGPNGQKLATAEIDEVIRLWDVSGCGGDTTACGTLAATLTGHEDRVRSLAFGSDGETLASGSLDETVRLWRVADGSPLVTVEIPDDRPGRLQWTTDLAFSPDGETLAGALWDDTVRLWRVADGKLQRTLDTPHYRRGRVAFSPNGLLLATSTAEDAVHLWRLDSGDLVHTLEGHGRPVLDMAFRDDATLLTTTDENIVCFWDIGGCANQDENCGMLQRTLEESAQSVGATLFDPDREQWVTFNEWNVIRMWQTRDGQMVGSSKGYAGWAESMAMHPDGALLASSTWDDILVWNIADSHAIRFVKAHEDRIYSLSFSPNGQILASASADGTVRLWRVRDWSLLRTLEGHEGTVLSLTFGPDSKSLASSGKDGAIHLWRVEDGLLLHSLDGGPGAVDDVTISPDGSLLASGSDDGSVRLWAVDGCAGSPGPCGEPLQDLVGHSAAVSSLAFSPDGTTLASGSLDSTVRLWSMDACLEQGEDCGRRLGILSEHRDRVQDLDFSADGRLLVSSSTDGTLRLWDVVDCSKEEQNCGHLLHTAEAGYADDVALSPDGTLLATNVPWAIQLWGVME